LLEGSDFEKISRIHFIEIPESQVALK